MIAAARVAFKIPLLLIDDDQETRRYYSATMQESGFSVYSADNLHKAKEMLLENRIRLVLLDIFLEGENGLYALTDLIHQYPHVDFYSITCRESIDLAIEAMQLGASGFFPKSLGAEKIAQNLKQKLHEEGDPAAENVPTIISKRLICKNRQMQAVSARIARVAQCSSTVLVQGESGTGKEVVARLIHDLSPRKDETFEAINCGAIPENLLESELFGHKRGAFTDAKADKKGLFEICSQGTLMLDEIGDMPMSLQVKLLRVLQEREIRPIGSVKSIRVNPRIIACTHRNLQQMVSEGSFRQDLYYRLSVLQLSIPPLRQRREDIPLLLHKFIDDFNNTMNKSINPPAHDLIVRLQDYDWPGNVRELQNTIERGIVLSQDNQLHYQDMFSSRTTNCSTNDGNVSAIPLVHEKARSQFERNYILQLLQKAKGNISQAARLSGKHRVEIYRLMRKHNLNKQDFAE